MKTRLVVVGGGISGLACAYRLQELAPHASITLLEGSSRLGGLLETVQKDGFLLEGAPDCFIADQPFIFDWLDKTGLKSESIGTTPLNRGSFIFENGKMQSVPKGFYLISPTSFKSLLKANLSLVGKLRMACEYWIPVRRDETDESVSSFIARRFGREALERIGQPMIGGIYTADPALLSVRAAMPRFWKMEQEHGSVIRALIKHRKSRAENQASGPRYSLFKSMARGMGQVPDLLASKMNAVKIRTAFPVKLMEKRGSFWNLVSETGEVEIADAVCLAVPAYRASDLTLPFAPELASALESIPYESAVTVNLGYREQDIPALPEGFGVVIPETEKRQIVGMTFSSRKFPGRAPENSVLIRVFAGGAFHREVMDLSDSEIQAMVKKELKEILKIEIEPLFCVLRRYPRAMPQYHVGHPEKVARIFDCVARQPGLFLTGNAYWGVGIPECIARGEEAAVKMASYAEGLYGRV